MNGDSFAFGSSSVKYNNFREDEEHVNEPSASKDATPQVKQSASSKKKETIIIVVLTIVILLLLCLTIAFGASNQKAYVKLDANLAGGRSSAIQLMSSRNGYPKSCVEARKLGMTSGIIKIQPEHSISFEAYCDMTAADGGWTLIASIHENNINGRCSTGDLWSSSSITNRYRSQPAGIKNWENLLTFGDIMAVTSQDFKSSAYFSLPASDLMIWHVPNDVPLNSISDEAFFKYYTDTQFLKKYGSTLQSMYTKYAPLKRVAIQDFTHLVQPCVTKGFALPEVFTNTTVTTASKPIRFDDEIYIKVNDGQYIKLLENQPNNISADLNITFNTASLPYTMLGWVSNSNNTIQRLVFKINQRGRSRSTSTRRRGSNTYATYFSSGDYIIRYKDYCLKNSAVCKIIYYMMSTKVWSSQTSFSRFNGTDPSNVTFSFSKSPRHIFIGYSVLSLGGRSTLSRNTIRSLLTNITNCLAKIDITKFNQNPSISTPAKFIKGSMADYVGNVTPGYMQFRKYDNYGFPYPLCPGIRVKNGSDTALHCVGGSPTHYSLRDQCGDFSAWDKLAEHNRKRAPSPEGFVGNTVTDLTSTLLLFARDSTEN